MSIQMAIIPPFNIDDFVDTGTQQIIGRNLDYLKGYTSNCTHFIDARLSKFFTRSLSDNDNISYRKSLTINTQIKGSGYVMMIETSYCDHVITLCRVLFAPSEFDLYRITLDIYGKGILLCNIDYNIKLDLLSFLNNYCLISQLKLTRLDYNKDVIGSHQFPLKRSKIKISRNAKQKHITGRNDILETHYIGFMGDSPIAYRGYRKDIEALSHNTLWLYYPEYSDLDVVPHIVRHELQLSDKYLHKYSPYSIFDIFNSFLVDPTLNTQLKRSSRTRLITTTSNSCKYYFNKTKRLGSKSDLDNLYSSITSIYNAK